MANINPFPMQDLDVDAALHTILEGTVTENAKRFIPAPVETLSKVSTDHCVQGVNFFARRGINESNVSASPNAS